MAALQSFAQYSQVQFSRVGAHDHLSGQVTRLVQAVQELSSRIPIATEPAVIAKVEPAADAGEEAPESRALATARRFLSVRRKRESAFGGKLFCDPAWDILVELYVARFSGSVLSVGDACAVSGAPLTSALRCCQALEKRGFVQRERDRQDRRRIFLRLTDDATATLTRILAA